MVPLKHKKLIKFNSEIYGSKETDSEIDFEEQPNSNDGEFAAQ
jgi:hypothetical protein